MSSTPEAGGIIRQEFMGRYFSLSLVENNPAVPVKKQWRAERTVIPPFPYPNGFFAVQEKRFTPNF
jgi:hypothetical protein